MKNTMKYKNYVAKVEYSAEDDELVGMVINTSRHGISFSGKTVSQAKKHMVDTIESYLINCKELNISPEKPYSGRISFRTTPKEHALLVEASRKNNADSLNNWMNKVLTKEAELELKSKRA